MVLVVSEESGRISLAVDGHMETPLDREALRRRLGELFSLEAGAGRAAGPPWWSPRGSGSASDARLTAPLGAQAPRARASRSPSGSS